MQLVPYAGFDPLENNFFGIMPAPLHDRERPKRRNPLSGRAGIDVKRATILKAQGLSWARIGEILATEDRRKLKYLGCSVRAAVCRERDR